MHRLLHSSYFTEIKLGSGILSNDTPKNSVCAYNPNQFSILYKYKLLRYRTEIPIATDLDFINENLNICDGMIVECKRFKENILDSGDRSFTEIGMDYEILLITKWKEYLTACYNNLSKIVEPSQFLWELRSGQRKLTQTDYNNIVINIQEAISSRFQYFKDKYDSSWDKALLYIFTTMVDYYKRIGDTPESAEVIKRLKIDLQLYSYNLIEKLDEFERFFQLILEENNTDDCVRLLVFLKGIILDFKVILDGHGYNFKKSYFFDIVNNFYQRMESEYNAEKLKLLTFKSIPIKKAINKKETSDNYSHKQIRIAYFIMDELITTDNAASIMKKHSNLTSVKKFLEKTITSNKSLTAVSENKTTDSKHLKDLKEAKRLLISLKNKKGIDKINHVLIEFETNYKNTYSI